MIKIKHLYEINMRIIFVCPKIKLSNITRKLISLKAEQLRVSLVCFLNVYNIFKTVFHSTMEGFS